MDHSLAASTGPIATEDIFGSVVAGSTMLDTGSGGFMASIAAIQMADENEDLDLRVWPLFLQRTKTGSIGVDSLAQIAEELGLECDGVALRNVIRPERLGQIYFDEALNYLRAAVRSSKDDYFETASLDRGNVDEGGVKHVSPLTALAMLCGCRSLGAGRGGAGGYGDGGAGGAAGAAADVRDYDDDSAARYKVDWSLCFDSKALLVISTLVVFISVAAATITFSSITWLNLAVSRQEDALFSFVGVYKEFAEAVEKRFLAAHVDSIKDTATTLARWTDYMWGRRSEEALRQLATDVRIVEQSVLFAAEAAMDALWHAVQENVTSLVRVVPVLQVATVPLVLSALREWVAWNPGLTFNVAVAGPEWPVRGGAPTPVATTIPAALPLCNFSRVATAVPVGGGGNEGGATFRSHGAVVVIDAPGGAPSASVRQVVAFIPVVGLLVCFMHADPAALELAVVVRLIDGLNAGQGPGRNDSNPEITVWRLNAAASGGRGGGGGAELLTQPRDDTSHCALGRVEQCAAFPLWVRRLLRREAFDDADELLDNRTRNDSRVFSRIVPHYYNGEEALVAAKVVPKLGIVLAHSVRYEELLRSYRLRYKEVIESMNWLFSRSTEIVLSTVSEATGRIVPQANTFRFSEKCLGECSRFPEASRTAVLSFQNESLPGGVIAPDYRPQPCISAYAKVLGRLNVSFIIERDVSDVHTYTLGTLTSITDGINAASTTNREIQLVRWPQAPVARLFDKDAPCPDSVFCLARVNFSGVAYRSDCPDCMHRPALEPGAKFQYVSQLRHREVCSEAFGAQCNGETRLARECLAMDSLEPVSNPTVATPVRLVSGTDYAGRPVVAAMSYVQHLATGVIVKTRRDALEAPILLSVGIAAAIAAGLTTAGLVLVTIASQRVLRTIDREWQTYKQQVDAEKQRFSQFVQYLVPRHLQRRLRSGQSIVAELSPHGCIAVIDIVGFSAMIRSWTPKQIVRFSTYYFYLLDELAARYGLFKLKVYGDVYVAVTALGKGRADQFERSLSSPQGVAGGAAAAAGATAGTAAGATGTVASSAGATTPPPLGRQGGGPAQGGDLDATHALVESETLDSGALLHSPSRAPPVLGTAFFVAQVLQLLSGEYAHRALFVGGVRDGGAGKGGGAAGGPAAGDGDGVGGLGSGRDGVAGAAPRADGGALNGFLVMPSVRIGLHYGPFVGGYVDLGRTPKFDCFGGSLQLANRMQVTAPPDRAHCTAFFKEALEAADGDGLFEFDQPRKTIARSRGTVMSFVIKTCYVPAPEDLVARLGISHAHHPHTFPDYDGRPSTSGQGSVAASVRSGSSAGSVMSRGSQRH